MAGLNLEGEGGPSGEPLLSNEERQPLVGGGASDTDKYAALVAQSNLRAMSIGMLMCLALYFNILMLRLELEKITSWPVYVDFIPLWILPILLFLAAADFAATRVGTGSALGKFITILFGFLAAVALLMALVLVCLRITRVVDISWMAVLAPVWAMVAVAQLVFCFLIPGFLKAGMQLHFFVMFSVVWLTALSALLTGLKLDEQLPHLQWWSVFVPAWVALAVIAAVLEKSVVDTSCRVTMLLCSIALAIRLDGLLECPWVLIILPIIAIIFMNIFQVFRGKEQDL